MRNSRKNHKLSVNTASWRDGESELGRVGRIHPRRRVVTEHFLLAHFLTDTSTSLSASNKQKPTTLAVAEIEAPGSMCFNKSLTSDAAEEYEPSSDKREVGTFRSRVKPEDYGAPAKSADEPLLSFSPAYPPPEITPSTMMRKRQAREGTDPMSPSSPDCPPPNITPTMMRKKLRRREPPVMKLRPLRWLVSRRMYTRV